MIGQLVISLSSGLALLRWKQHLELSLPRRNPNLMICTCPRDRDVVSSRNQLSCPIQARSGGGILAITIGCGQGCWVERAYNSWRKAVQIPEENARGLVFGAGCK
jgi:hypothetical protein